MAAMKMRALGSAEVQAKADADLKKDIMTGTGKMKAQTVTDAQAADLVAYIRTLKK
jgi:mono/diheme cytochrome c family protein